MEGVEPEKESSLLASLNKITNFVRQNPGQTMNYFAPLLQNIHFRSLFSQALHLLWHDCSSGLDQKDLTAFNNINMTKSYLGVLAKQVFANDKANNDDPELLKVTAYIKKLYEFEQFISEGITGKHPISFYRERGFGTLDWLTILLPSASRNVIANILIQAGIYFQMASGGKVSSRKKADEKLALYAYMEAINLASRSAPDLEIYTLCNCLKFIAAFNYQDDDLKGLINTIQTRVLLLVDLFPVYIRLQSNVDLVRNNEQTLGVMKNFLHTLIAIIEQNKSASNPIHVAHEYVNVL